MLPVARILGPDEQEIWRRGPVAVFDEWFTLSTDRKLKALLGNRKATNWRKVYYLLSNKRALILDGDKLQEIIAQCNLSECEIVIANMPSDYGSFSGVPMEVTPTGDMLFLKDGKIVLKYLKVQDPESVLALIKTVIRGNQ